MPKFSIITTGRNDNYDGNFSDRLAYAMSMNMRQMPEEEFIFVEWNPIMDKPLVCEGLKRLFADRVRYMLHTQNFILIIVRFILLSNTLQRT